MTFFYASLTKNATKLTASYLSDRKQQIKIGNVVSSWEEIKKGVHQGSILGPFLFNDFINNFFYFIKNCDLYNYADDNTLSFHSPNFDEIIKVLQEEGNMLIDWFYFNCMQANPNTFQVFGVGKEHMEDLQLSNLDPSKLHVMKKLNFWVLI